MTLPCTTTVHGTVIKHVAYIRTCGGERCCSHMPDILSTHKHYNLCRKKIMQLRSHCRERTNRIEEPQHVVFTTRKYSRGSRRNHVRIWKSEFSCSDLPEEVLLALGRRREWRKPAENDVRDDAGGPHVHRKRVPHGCLRDDLRCDVRRRATNGVKGLLDPQRQAEISELDGVTAGIVGCDE